MAKFKAQVPRGGGYAYDHKTLHVVTRALPATCNHSSKQPLFQQHHSHLNNFASQNAYFNIGKRISCKSSFNNS